MKLTHVVTKEPVSKRELLAYSAELKGEIFRQIRERLNWLEECGSGYLIWRED